MRKKETEWNSAPKIAWWFTVNEIFTLWLRWTSNGAEDLNILILVLEFWNSGIQNIKQSKNQTNPNQSMAKITFKVSIKLDWISPRNLYFAGHMQTHTNGQEVCEANDKHINF